VAPSLRASESPGRPLQRTPDGASEGQTRYAIDPMTYMPTKVSTLQEYIGIVGEICSSWGALLSTTHPWFRGQGDISWPLLPRLYRLSENPEYEREMYRDFRLRATAFLRLVPSHDLEWLFVMQHYGIPTRLLDWTESHLSALYFAVLDFQSAKDGAVWVLDPWSLNKLSLGWQSVPPSTEEVFADYVLKLNEGGVVVRKVKASKPVAVRPARSTERIVAQRGTFTIHGRSTASLDNIAKVGKKSAKLRLACIPIDGNSKTNLLKELFLAGISHSVIFPDLEGLSKEIHFRYSKPYLG
jgi:FRG domain-containing protein